MPKRNIVWLLIGVLVAVLLWKAPEAWLRRDQLYTQFAPLLDVRAEVLKNYVEPVDEDVLLRGAIDGMLNRLDPYSEYYNETEFEQFQRRTEGQFIGIGIEIGQLDTGEIVVASPIEGTPAFMAGLRSDDRIVEIDGQTTSDMKLNEAVDRISGKPGTDVTLTIVRPPDGEPRELTITRGVITVVTVRGWARTEDWEWDYLIDPETRI